MNKGKTIMLQGTASDVGKSLIAAALCRIFWQDGYTVAPFKSQNMSLNSYVTPDGKEIGRAQGMQADACRVAASTDMNPILLKPKQDMVSEVIVHGRPYRDLSARAYREQYLQEAAQIVQDALHRLRSEKEIVVIEGAGSPAEINLKDRDIVNMNAAKWAEAPVILVADIDRGGVFASIVGTMEILTPEERERVAGFIINKFRGDVSLLTPGLDWLEQKTGKPVFGVVPFLPNLELEDEDGASLDAKTRLYVRSGAKRDDFVDIAVLKLPRISNFTDIDPLMAEEDVRVRFIDHVSEWDDPDAVIIPGSKSTVSDLTFLREQGFEHKLQEYAAAGGYVLGIGAGFQMLGERLNDPYGIESNDVQWTGIGLLPVETTFTNTKRTVRIEGTCELYGGRFNIRGYEVYLGEMEVRDAAAQPLTIASEQSGGQASARNDGAAMNDGRVWGTYVHGILHNDLLRRAWINELRKQKGWTDHPDPIDFGERRERAFDRLAAHVREHVAMDDIYRLLNLPSKG